ncbi:Esterase/lipase [Paenibacillus sp. UNCCL117]|uniref:alpha/beta hydrolase n=1 Tax=unclassified Paenibacillus TaxID=185978 RepID=UPI00088E9DB5|nr:MULTISPECIES: alpha/beta fold hydrolase [unclassified Paenibacillus]SDC45860.1 Esterase/lipase [Paenibacillus sp. cl123]SFW12412.1 Esterase/lipase [Paenibacillus sp. UNCCL117]
MKERGCLLLHGFTGGPFEVEPLADYLHGLGYECRIPMLPGHDQELRELGRVSWRDWLDAAAGEAYEMSRQYETFDVVGFSMGGLLSAYVANRFPIRRLVLLNAAAIYVSPLLLIRDLAERMRLHDWEHWGRVKRVPLLATLQFMKLARYAKTRELGRVAVPTLIAQGRKDQIVHPRSARYIYNRLQGDKELIYFPQSRHMLCFEPDAPEVFRTVGRFLSLPN